MDSLHGAMTRLRPSMLFLDSDFLRTGTAKEVGHIAHLSPTTRIIYFGQSLDEADQIRMLKAGVKGICPINVDISMLRKAVEIVQRGDIWVSRRTLTSLLDHAEGIGAEQAAWSQVDGEIVYWQNGHHPPAQYSEYPDQLQRLSARQRQIAKLLANGGTNKEIASNLGIAESTVKAHLTSIFRKVGVSDRLSLALIFTQRQMQEHR